MTEIAQALFSRLFVESRDALRRYVRRLVRSDESAEEIVQEAFLRTYERRDHVETPRAFLFSTARNLATDRTRRDRNSPEEVLREFGDVDAAAGAALDDELLAAESMRVLKEAIEHLPPQQQAALTLRLFHGHSHKEIGAILGISWTTVKRHIELGTFSVRKHVLERYTGGQGG